MRIADEVRQILRASPKSQREIADETGIPQPRISRFVNDGEVRTDTFDRLYEWAKEQIDRPLTSRK